MYSRYIKRILDVVLSLLAMILLSPILLCIAVLTRICLGAPVLFRQKRPGKNEKIFTMYKFRSMTDATDKNGTLLKDCERLTPFGRFLRSTSLDELPELFNILKGDMSIVGPRPQLVRDMVFMTEQQRERHRVRPGLSGLAQVNGRNGISWEKKLEFDLEYIQHITFAGDVRIVLKTICKMLTRQGINTEGMETAEDLGDYLLKSGKSGKEKYEMSQLQAEQLLMKG